MGGWRRCQRLSRHENERQHGNGKRADKKAEEQRFFEQSFARRCLHYATLSAQLAAELSLPDIEYEEKCEQNGDDRRGVTELETAKGAVIRKQQQRHGRIFRPAAGQDIGFDKKLNIGHGSANCNGKQGAAQARQGDMAKLIPSAVADFCLHQLAPPPPPDERPPPPELREPPELELRVLRDIV